MKYLTKSFKIILSFAALIIIGIIVFFGHRDIPLNELKAKYTNTASSFIAVDRMDVHFRDEGDQTDTIPIVLIHGTASSLHTFDTWTDSLKKSNRVIRMDLPAYGLTGPFPDRNYSMAHYTQFLKNFLTALKIKQCVLAGNSLGGEIAWNFTLEEPEMVKKLILIDAAGYPLSSKSVPIAFKIGRTPLLNKVLTYITPRFIVKASVENVYFDKSKVTESLVDRYFELTLRAGNRQAFVDRFKMAKDTSAYKNIKHIQQPTLILWGAKDLLIPVENANKFHKDLPINTLVILDNNGHTPMEESPMESLKPVLDFLKNSKQVGMNINAEKTLKLTI
ncbi:alpha/beta fold hydrolase [Flavobacterium frigoris]|uniref:Pimeloyl-ACP methyl ester carboxylesterase n=1 Tax=Flavobacterium frigoris TaxID=229204 RepID=A0A1H9RHT7_FLAFI|nr:alpha/beta hydrolase [Flavobacterium frigoris]SER72316.1 Pimeloyl-ACP methyl ester carboxylesterase [Flavobacterium frigoris]